MHTRTRTPAMGGGDDLTQGSLLRGFDNKTTLAFQLVYLLVAVMLSWILKKKQKLGVTFNFNRQDIIDFTKFSKMTMSRGSEANSEK